MNFINVCSSDDTFIGCLLFNKHGTTNIGRIAGLIARNRSITVIAAHVLPVPV
jgi:hypothetical protein